jgi:zinc protease
VQVSRFAAVLLLASSLLFAPGAHAASTAPASEIAQDSAVRAGVLPNGLRYVLMSNSQPAKLVSIRLHITVGSYDEADDERGVAHFIEHMAFNGTKGIPEGELDTRFENAGVAFGRDQNAETSYFGTTYQVDMPQADEAKLDLAFHWLRDVADGMTLDPASVNRERGVIQAENDRAMGPERTWAERIEHFFGPELRSLQRDPIGTRESIAGLDVAKLKAFHDKWYRPDQAIVVVAGDAPLDALEKRITETFGSWTAEGPPPARVAVTAPNHARGLDVLTANEASLPTSINLCWTRPDDEDGPDSVSATRFQLERRLWRDVLNERFRAVAAGDQPPFVAAQVSTRKAAREAVYVCLDLLPVNDDWRRGLTAATTEIRRFAAHGPSREETRRALEGVRAEHRAASDQAPSRNSTGLADMLLRAETDERVIATPSERFRVLNRAAVGLDARAVAQAFRRDWNGGGPLLVVTTPEPTQIAAVKAAWTQAMAGRAPAAATAVKPAVWAYTNFGPAGTVASREEVADPGFVRLRFENGVVLNFKSLANSKDQVRVRVRFGAGRREIPTSAYYASQLGAQLFVEGGLGRHDAETLRRLFNDHGWGAELQVLNDAFVLGGSTNATDLKAEMEILTAFLSDPGFRRSLDAKLPTAVELMTRMSATSPEFAASQALNEALAPDGAFVTPPKEKLLALDSGAFEALFKPALTQAPLEVTIVGDITEAQAIAAAARTMGALPPRSEARRARADTWFLRYPDRAPATIRTTYDGPGEKAIVSLVWPLYVAEPARRREEYALVILSGVLDDAIRHRVREEMGKAYAPQVAMNSPDKADQGSIMAQVETASADADAVAAAVRETVADIAAKGTTAAAFDAARKPALAAGATRLEDIDWWLGGLDGSAREPEILNEFLGWERDYGSVTLADVQKAAKTWLAKPPIVVIAEPSSQARSAAVAAAAQ